MPPLGAAQSPLPVVYLLIFLDKNPQKLLINMLPMTLSALNIRFSLTLVGFALCFLGFPHVCAGNTMVGGKTVVSLGKKDTLAMIGARFGVDWQLLAKENGLTKRKIYRPGEQISINNLRIVPKRVEDGIIINVPDRMLYFFRNSEIVMSFPVGLGMPDEEWQTPIGSFRIVRKARNPTWFVPKSIQNEMRKKGQPVKTIVPPGKDNPLGRYALYTTMEGVLIHETIWPTTVYQWRSHGCIRVNPEVMEEFFDQVEPGMTGEIIYQPVSVAVQEDRVFLQVGRDIYGKLSAIDRHVEAEIHERGLSDTVDWAKVHDVLKKKKGLAEDVTR